MRLGETCWTVTTALLVCVACGCVSTPVPQVHKSVPPGSSYLLYLPGITGTTVIDQAWLGALHDAGAAGDFDVYDWTKNRSSFLDALEAHDENHRVAAQIGKFIEQTRGINPDTPIICCGASGGAGLTVWALEALPRGTTVNDVLLIAPALSPDYDLSAALRHVSGALYYLSSPLDAPTNGGGTLLFGTIDGKHSAAAGFTGFHQPPGADPAQYRKLVELKYDPAWIAWGNFGSHMGGLSSAFATHVLAPMLVKDERQFAAEAAPSVPAATEPTAKPAVRIQRFDVLPR
jgi:hypothetical protein